MNDANGNVPSTDIVPETTAKIVVPPPVVNEDGTITQHRTFQLPAPAEKRLEIAKSLSFDTIADIGLAKKEKKRVEDTKKYAQLVRESQDKLDGSTTYPDPEKTPMEQIKEFFAAIAYGEHYNALLSARRAGTDLPLTMSYTIFDLMGEGEEEDVDEYKDALNALVDSFSTEKGYNEATKTIVQFAILGSKTQILRLRKFFAPKADGSPGALDSAQNKFAEWAADKQDSDFENAVMPWMKRQNKRLASAKATKEISETEVTI